MISRFGSFALDTVRRQLTRHDEVIPLAPKTFDLLLLLVESDGRALSKAELMSALWPDTFVEEANLSFQISTLRKALGEDGARWIETIPKHGYRFGGAARPVAADPPPVAPVRRRRWLWVVAAAVAGAAIIVLGARNWPTAGVSPARTPQPLTSYPGAQQQPSLSPDGSQVAFAWNGPNEDNFDIYVKLVGPGEPVRLTTDPARDIAPSWSPDGRQIAFLRFTSRQHGGIFLIPALGGAEQKLADISVALIGHQTILSWTSDNGHVLVGGRFKDDEPFGIWLVSTGGGPPRRITRAGADVPFDFAPTLSPDGRLLAFVRYNVERRSQLYIQRLGPDLAPIGDPAPITAPNVRIESAAWVNDRKLVYCSGQTHALHHLETIEITSDGKPARPPQPVDFGEGAHALSVSRNGNLVYGRQVEDVNLWRLDLSAGPGRAPQRLVASTFEDWTPAWSHDGRRLAFASTRSGLEEIWVVDADGGRPLQITRTGSGHTANPRWAPGDGAILFNSWNPRSHLYRVTLADGSVKQLTSTPGDEVEPDWSRDGKWIYYGSARTGRLEIFRMAADSGPAVQVTRQGGLHAEESTDGKWVYYSKDADLDTSLWKVARDGGEETLVFDGLSYSTNFAVGDKGIYFVSRNAIEFFDFGTRKRTVLSTLGKPFSWGISLSPDQRSLVYSVVDHAASNLMFVENYR